MRSDLPILAAYAVSERAQAQGCPVTYLDDITFTDLIRSASGPEYKSGRYASDGFLISVSLVSMLYLTSQHPWRYRLCWVIDALMGLLSLSRVDIARSKSQG